MNSVLPVEQRGNAPAVRKNGEWPEKIQAGTFNFYSRGENNRAGILFGCPCGCGEMMSIAFEGTEGDGPKWKWDGNEAAPTTTPSILIHQLAEDTGAIVGEHWHGYLTNGWFQSC